MVQWEETETYKKKWEIQILNVVSFQTCDLDQGTLSDPQFSYIKMEGFFPCSFPFFLVKNICFEKEM